MKKITVTIISLSLFGTLLSGQPLPAENQKEAILIQNATAHLGNGTKIENAVIGFENGKITLVADATTVRFDVAQYKKVINAQGKHVYPGFIATNTPLGLVEVDAVRATSDQTEVGEMNPSVRSIVAYNTDSYVTPTVRSNGVLLAQIVPEGGRVSGQSSVVELDGWNWEDAAYNLDEGMHLRWPSVYSFNFDPTAGFVQRKNDNYPKQIIELDAFFREAQAYAKKENPLPQNLKFEAMRTVFSQKRTLFVHANLVKEMTEGVLFGKKYGCKTVIVGGKDAWMMTDLLKENNVAVVLNETQWLPVRNDDDYDQPFKTPALLKAAGIPFCISVSKGGWQNRNLPLMAGQAVGHGLAYEDAVTAITASPAKILGIDAAVGTLEVGKDATLIITEGDALDMRTSKVQQAFIRGKEIDLNNKQRELYRRFQTKYERQKR